MIKLPKDDKIYKWSGHIKGKMIYYRLSSQTVRGILRSPARTEEGIAPGTSAAMKRRDTRKRKEEIWVMCRRQKPASGKFKIESSKVIMISAWRYPGVSRPGKEIPIPNDIREELGL